MKQNRNPLNAVSHRTCLSNTFNSIRVCPQASPLLLSRSYFRCCSFACRSMLKHSIEFGYNLRSFLTCVSSLALLLSRYTSSDLSSGFGVTSGLAFYGIENAGEPLIGVEYKMFRVRRRNLYCLVVGRRLCAVPLQQV